MSDDHAAWIAAIREKFRAALIHAAHGADFDWDLYGPDGWPDPAPEADELWPPEGSAWPGPNHPAWPDPPGLDAGYEQIKRYANTQAIADMLMGYDEAFNLPTELWLSPEEAWRLAEKAYDRQQAGAASE